MATVREARVDIGLFIIDAWNDNEASDDYGIFVEGHKYTPPKNAPWARITIKHNTGGQVGFGSGRQLYRYHGIVIVDIFTPITNALGRHDAGALNDTLIQIVKDLLEGARTSGAGVVFQNVTPREVGNDGGFYQQQVAAEFNYEHVH